jgi:hypothetical protein
MPQINDLIKELDACPNGRSGWSQFEDICTRILEYLFVPPLTRPNRQSRTYSGVNRRDAIFPNRNITNTGNRNSLNWYHLYVELQARFVLFEFKNYDTTSLGHEEVNQTRNYLTSTIGKLGIIVSTKEPDDSALRQRNIAYTQEGKVILFLKREHLKEMLAVKERDEDPSDLIMDMIELFYIQHE